MHNIYTNEHTVCIRCREHRYASCVHATQRYCGVRTDKRHLHLHTKPNGIIRKHCSTYCFICAKQSTLFLAKFIDHTHILIMFLILCWFVCRWCSLCFLPRCSESHIAKAKNHHTCHLCHSGLAVCVCVLSCVCKQLACRIPCPSNIVLRALLLRN